MNFGSFGAGFGSFGAGVGGLLPSFTNITSWLRSPTTDGKTLVNSKGTDANLTGVNCLQFTAGGSADYVALANDITTTTSWTNEFDVNWSNFGSASSGVSFLSADDQTRWWRINGSDGNSLFIEGKIGNTQFREINISADVSLSLNTTYRIKTVWSGTSVAIYIDGTLANTYNWGNDVTPNTFGNIGRPVATSGTAKISNWKFYHNGILEAHLPLAEGTGTEAYDVSGKGNHGTIVNSTWTTADGMESWNHEYGHDLVGVLNGTVSGFDTGIGGDELDMYEIKMQSTADVGGDGNSYFVSNGATNPTLFMTNTTQGSGKRMAFRLPTGSIENLSGVSSADFNIYKVDYTNTSSVKVFVNGELELTSTQTAIPTSSTFNIGNISAAGASDNGFFYYFKGWKDGVLKIYAVLDPSGRVRDLVSGNLLTADVGGTGSLGIKRIPALNTKTTQVATFDGIDDKLTATGITSSSVITHDGTATLTAGTGEITSTAGTAYNIKIDGVLTFTMSSGIGTSTIPSVNGSIGDASVVGSSGALETFWGQRVADTAGSLVSADYATLNGTTFNNPGGFVHNGSECGVDMVTNDLTSAQLFAIDNSTATQTFVRKDNGNILQILDYSSALTGDDLTRTRNYVG